MLLGRSMKHPLRHTKFVNQFRKYEAQNVTIHQVDTHAARPDDCATTTDFLELSPEPIGARSTVAIPRSDTSISTLTPLALHESKRTVFACCQWTRTKRFTPPKPLDKLHEFQYFVKFEDALYAVEIESRIKKWVTGMSPG